MKELIRAMEGHRFNHSVFKAEQLPAAYREKERKYERYEDAHLFHHGGSLAPNVEEAAKSELNDWQERMEQKRFDAEFHHFEQKSGNKVLAEGFVALVRRAKA